jgi:adenine-specific DNA methylase
MTIDQAIQFGIFLVGVLSVGLTLIAIWDSKAKAREETRLKNEEKLQQKAHDQAKEIGELKEARVESLFAAMGKALKQMQDDQREEKKDRIEFSADLKNHRVEVQSLQTVTKIEMDHIKATLSELRSEVKSVVTHLGGGMVRVSGPKFPGG